MRKKRTIIPVFAAVLVGISCFSMHVFAYTGGGNETNKNEDTLDPSAGAGATVMDTIDETGVFTGYHKEMQDTNNIITDTTDKTTLNKEEMSDNELKSAIKNWIESLWTETPDVDVQGYEDGNITRVLKSHMNIIPYKELIGQQWVPCDPDDIGAVRF